MRDNNWHSEYTDKSTVNGRLNSRADRALRHGYTKQRMRRAWTEDMDPYLKDEYARAHKADQPAAPQPAKGVCRTIIAVQLLLAAVWEAVLLPQWRALRAHDSTFILRWVLFTVILAGLCLCSFLLLRGKIYSYQFEGPLQLIGAAYILSLCCAFIGCLSSFTWVPLGAAAAMLAGVIVAVIKDGLAGRGRRKE